MGWFMAAYHTGLDLIVPGQLVIREPASKAGGLLDQGSFTMWEISRGHGGPILGTCVTPGSFLFYRHIFNSEVCPRFLIFLHILLYHISYIYIYIILSAEQGGLSRLQLLCVTEPQHPPLDFTKEF